MKPLLFGISMNVFALACIYISTKGGGSLFSVLGMISLLLGPIFSIYGLVAKSK